jgi:hypothetical protein
VERGPGLRCPRTSVEIPMLFTLALSLALQSQSAPALPETPRDAVFGELAPHGESLDDAMPSPTAAQWNVAADGDHLAAAASGDAFFLGFAPGKYFPPAQEHVDPELAVAAWSLPNDGRPARETYGFVMFSKRMTEERFTQLQDLGARVLEFHPFYCVKVALAAEAIEPIAALDFVRWVGVARTWQKLDASTFEQVAQLEPGERLPVFINVFESDLNAASTSHAAGIVQESDGDHTLSGNPLALPRTWMSNGWQQRALGALGVEIVEYLDSVHAFRGTVDPAALEALVALDFVQFVEPQGQGAFYHDESMPMINADRTRVSYDGGTNSAAIMAVLDTGCYTGHAAIDPLTVGWDFTAEGAGPFDDGCGHGTHVCGTLLGNEDVEDSYTGVAPGLGWATTGRFYFGKMGESDCSLSYTFGGMTSAMHTPYTDGSGNTTPIPMGISCSWGNNSTAPFGTDTHARAWDAEVWDNDQQYIFAMGNAGPTAGVMGQQPAAKNVFSVGSVTDWPQGGVDPADLASDSSRGPTADGRWKPNVCAPGSSIRSCAAGTTTAYINKSGTSMATPHVAGVAAQLCDHYSFLRYNPACLSAVLMATAVTRNDVALTTPSASASHLNTFGTGRVDAYKAQYGDSQQALYFWSSALTWSQSTSVDFPINSGATRVTIVVHYKEPEASSGASQALINDFDSYIDASPFSAGNNTGDYVAQQSSVDNTEVRIINNPTATNWRIKVYPTAAVPFQVVRVGICAVVTYGDTTPTPTFNVSASDYYLQPNETASIFAYYFNPSYVASAVYFDSTSSAFSVNATSTLIDGATADYGDDDVEIGNVLHGTSRSATWTGYWISDGVKPFTVEARSDNAVDVTDTVNITVDGTQPGTVTNLHSTTHTANVWSNDTSITWAWTAATDNLSGIDGYGVYTTAAANLPGATKDVEQVTSYSETLGAGTWWFSIRSVDNCGNWDDDYASYGPIKIETTPPSAPTNVASPTHPAGVQQCGTVVQVNWTAVGDNLGGSGVAGYVATINQIPNWDPPGPANVTGGATSFSMDIGSVPSGRWIHVRTIDVAGNLSPTVHVGPIYANSASVTIYCTGKTNSAGCVPAIGTNGVQPSKSAGNFAVTCSNALNQKNGLLFFGFSPAAVAFQGGIKCVASPTYRGPNSNSGGTAGGSDCTGTYSQLFDTAFMNAYSLDPGDTVYAQWWTRDPAVASTTGLSNAIQFTVCQ